MRENDELMREIEASIRALDRAIWGAFFATGFFFGVVAALVLQP
jgi:hypothetical protein